MSKELLAVLEINARDFQEVRNMWGVSCMNFNADCKVFGGVDNPQASGRGVRLALEPNDPSILNGVRSAGRGEGGTRGGMTV